MLLPFSLHIEMLSGCTSGLFLCLVAGCCLTAKVHFSYNTQDEWEGVCNVGNNNMQSPIDITTNQARVDSSLKDLQFNGAWGARSTGTFNRNGHNVQFNPSAPGSATTVNHLGTYLMQQVHMHWGRRSGEGAEHRVNGNQAQLEIHFVHTKQGVLDTTQRDYITVIAVLADVEEVAATTGPWAQLNITKIQSNSTSGTPVTGLVLNELLPNSRGIYYYYPGSLTTPPCSETVQWFVFKERISVPSAYVKQLRKVQEDSGTPLEFNFREAQSLGNRVILTASHTVNKPFIIILMLCLLVAKLF